MPFSHCSYSRMKRLKCPPDRADALARGYLNPASLRSCTSDKARLPVTKATEPTAATTGKVWKRFQLV